MTELIILPRDFLAEELLCDQHNLQQALDQGKLKFTKSLAKDTTSQMRLQGFRYGMPKERVDNGA